MKMKIISLTLFLLTFMAADTAEDFFATNGPFQDKFNAYGIFECIEDCTGLVATDRCASTCKADAKNFTILMAKAFQRFQKKMCDFDLGNITYGQVNIPLKMNTNYFECYMEGPLTVSVVRNNRNPYQVDSSADYPYYVQKANLIVDFKGLELFCSKCSKTRNVHKPFKCSTKFQSLGRVDVKLNITYKDCVMFKDQQNPNVEHKDHDASVSAKYLKGPPKTFSQSEIQTALDFTFNTELINARTLMTSFQYISYILFESCITPTCGQCPE